MKGATRTLECDWKRSSRRTGPKTTARRTRTEFVHKFSIAAHIEGLSARQGHAGPGPPSLGRMDAPPMACSSSSISLECHSAGPSFPRRDEGPSLPRSSEPSTGIRDGSANVRLTNRQLAPFILGRRLPKSFITVQWILAVGRSVGRIAAPSADCLARQPSGPGPAAVDAVGRPSSPELRALSSSARSPSRGTSCRRLLCGRITPRPTLLRPAISGLAYGMITTKFQADR